MKALKFHQCRTEPELREVRVPEPGPREVLIRVAAAGACPSDLHVMQDFEPGELAYELPFTLGPENAGHIEALGDIALAGIGDGTLGVSFFPIPQGVSVATTYWGGNVERQEAISLAEQGEFEVHIERFALGNAMEAYHKLQRGDISGRAAVDPR